MCRTEIRCWTTKRLVELTLDEQRHLEEVPMDEQMKQEKVPMDEQRQLEEVPMDEQMNQEEVPMDEHRQQEGVHLDEQRRQKEVHLDEQRQQEEVPLYEQRQQEEVNLDEQRQLEEVSQIPNTKERSTPSEIFYELCRFDSPANFLNCLKCLKYKKNELSFMEIVLILRANLSMILCFEHGSAFIVKSKFNTPDMWFILLLIKSTTRFLLTEVQNRRLTLPFQDSFKPLILLICILDIQDIVKKLAKFFAAEFPNQREEVFEHERATLNMLIEIENFVTF